MGRCGGCVTCLSFCLLLCVDGELVCAEGCTQVTGVMAMMMTGRVLLVCALCVLWCGLAGSVYARDVGKNALGGCMASGVLRTNGSHVLSGCNKPSITVPLRHVFPITVVDASDKDNSVPLRSASDSSVTSSPGVTGPAGADIPGKAGLGAGAPAPGVGGDSGSVSGGGVKPPSPAAPSGPSGHSAPSSVDGEHGASVRPSLEVDSSHIRSDEATGSSGRDPSNTEEESPRREQLSSASLADNPSSPDIPAETTSDTQHGQQKEEQEEEEEEEEEEVHETQQQNDEIQVQQQQQHQHPAENGEESAKDKTATPSNVTAKTGDSDGSTAVSHTTSPLLLLLVACAAAAAAVVAS
ncbi:mucin-associated surface protein (MASP), putative [Trypanosoma cruzi marinkellei]|uniref:Mucin-associated surface protein (MASP), putative n=1 Tax=Trypanosoma cruzi marinkellei TaxID=85056 RepID=K2NAD6_TRYCR|nr:mucin-associated surface protein (MASP), putative [Trypanosoma cruzi marinkellei]